MVRLPGVQALLDGPQIRHLVRRERRGRRKFAAVGGGYRWWWWFLCGHPKPGPRESRTGPSVVMDASSAAAVVAAPSCYRNNGGPSDSAVRSDRKRFRNSGGGSSCSRNYNDAMVMVMVMVRRTKSAPHQQTLRNGSGRCQNEGFHPPTGTPTHRGFRRLLLRLRSGSGAGFWSFFLVFKARCCCCQSPSRSHRIMARTPRMRSLSSFFNRLKELLQQYLGSPLSGVPTRSKLP